MSYQHEQKKQSIWSEGTKGCFPVVWLWAAAFVLVGVLMFFLPDSFAFEGILLSMFLAFVGIGDIIMTVCFEKKLSKPGVIIALVSIVWFGLSMIPGSIFQLKGLLDVMLGYR